MNITLTYLLNLANEEKATTILNKTYLFPVSHFSLMSYLVL